MSKELKDRILGISYEHKLSHIGSCLSAVDIIDAIYSVKKDNERFVLSSGHAGVALYCVLEKYGYGDAEEMLEKAGIHADRVASPHIDVSTGSLGQGLPIAVGMALADRDRNVYCVISDGECAEGSVWEALRIGYEQGVENLKIFVNANGWGAYGKINKYALINRFAAFGWAVMRLDGHNREELLKGINQITGGCTVYFCDTKVEHHPALVGQDAHYHILTDEEYEGKTVK